MDNRTGTSTFATHHIGPPYSPATDAEASKDPPVERVVQVIRGDRPMSSHPTPLAYSVPDAAAMLGIGRTKCFDLIQRGELPSVTIGRRRLVLAEQLQAYCAELAAADAP